MIITITKEDCFYEDGTQREYGSMSSCPLHAVMEKYYPDREFGVGGNAIYFADNTPPLHYDIHAWNSSVMKDLLIGEIEYVELELTTKL